MGIDRRRVDVSRLIFNSVAHLNTLIVVIQSYSDCDLSSQIGVSTIIKKYIHFFI
jgi:hypothetical protein